MMLIDFEKKFTEYLNDYLQSHQLDDDAIDEQAPDLYLDWLDMPMEWLDGKSANAYFGAMDAVALIKALARYMLSDISLPGPLLNRIADLRDDTHPMLIALMKNYDGEKSDEIKAIVLNLIEEMDMSHPYEYYIETIANSVNKNDFAEACADQLRNAGDAYTDRVITAYETAKDGYAAECFLDILTDLPYDERTYNYTIERFLFCDSQKAFYASCLGKIGNSNAIPALEEALRQEHVRYFDYLSIKNALEELGGEVEIDRDFTGDSDFEALKDTGDIL